MNWFTRTFTYSIGKKIIMALTGIFLVTFLIEHLVGNLLLLAGDEGVAYAEYSHWAVNNPFIRTVEIVLVFGFLFHIVDGIILTLQNKKARGSGYVVNRRPSSYTSRNMIISGLVLLAFLGIHLASFFWPYRVSDVGHTDLFQVAVHKFKNPLFCGFYILSFILLGMHLWHGFSSAFQTIGMRHPKYYPAVKGLGYILAIGLPLGFAVIALYFLLIYQIPA
ncbi:MAG: succinate dehydrogenase cytochrome b subunit [Sphingobacteriales bacterium]|nr:MAG: succinate dehydrogenase cytochrome b subunit [Sphingobacteriales bacterium]